MSVAPDDPTVWQTIATGAWEWEPIVPSASSDEDVVDLTTRLHLVPSLPDVEPTPPAAAPPVVLEPPPPPPPPPPATPAPSVLFGDPMAAPVQPTAAPAPAEPRRDLRGRRIAIVAGLVALVALIPIDLLVGRVIHDQRQRHLAHDVQAGTRKVAPGEALMVLQIPQIGFNQVVIEGSSADDLRAGPGHVIGTSQPGQAGNVVVVGHRSRYEGPFGDLGNLAEGAQIAVRTRTGDPVRFYAVDTVRRVDADDRSALRRTKDERLTLVTAASGLAPDRLVVVAADPVESTPAAERAGRYAPAPDALDAASASVPLGLALVVAVIGAMAAAGYAASRWLARRYSPITVAAVLVPAAAVGLVVALRIADAVLPGLV